MKRVLEGKAVNFHITEACNMSCKFCFAKYDTKNELSKLDSFKVIELLANSGVKKLNFAGGEPFIKNHLGLLIQYAKSLGLITGVITNGSYLSIQWIETFGKYIDWFGISIDSLEIESNIESGRVERNGRGQNSEKLELYLNHLRMLGALIKINTVVSAYNKMDNLSSFIEQVKPHRWKIFQALPIKGANDMFDFEVTANQYNNFLRRHQEVINKFNTYPEDNRLMTSSYLMVNPEGRFYENSKGKHSYSDHILKVGVKKALSQVVYDHLRFIKRGGEEALMENGLSVF